MLIRKPISPRESPEKEKKQEKEKSEEVQVKVESMKVGLNYVDRASPGGKY